MDITNLPTPFYLIDEQLLENNLKVLKKVKDRTDCRILLAQKAFSAFYFYPLIKKYLDGTTASGLFEAKLGKQEMGGETHVFSAAYREDEMDELSGISDHIVFNSIAQLLKFKDKVLSKGKEIAIRINPECSTQESNEIYDPCARFSRLGITRENLDVKALDKVSGLHFHTLCEQNADALQVTLDAVIKKFGDILPNFKWVNFGGGHHITREDYDIELLIKCILDFKERYGMQVYLEPGEAVALNAGFLVTTVLDVVTNGMDIAILDTSAACHMPDVIEMPYRPPLKKSGKANEKKHTYRLAGPTCLAGDIIGDYSFDNALSVGDRLIFEDMAIYTMVKNNTFNGMMLPSIVVKKKNGEYEIIKKFGFSDFKNRLS